MKKASIYLLFFAIVIGVQILGSWAGNQGLPNWYQSLTLPAWTPPGWVFGPVWTILYIMIALSGAWFALEGAKKALTLWGIQLGLNGLWSFLFFALQKPLWALIDLILLDCTVFGLIWVGYSSSKKASLILIPYLLWILYATTLNWGIVVLN